MFYTIKVGLLEANEKLKNKFFSCVDKTGDCWEWTAYKNRGGYGTIRVGAKKQYAHRVSYYINTGEDPGGKCVCHRCDNPACVNPDHLFLGTHKDNTLDMLQKNRQIKGEQQTTAKISETQVKAILTLVELGFTRKRVAEIFKIKVLTVYRIVKGRAWKHVKRKEAR